VPGARAKVKRVPKTGRRTVQLEITADGKKSELENRRTCTEQCTTGTQHRCGRKGDCYESDARRCRTNVDRLLLEKALIIPRFVKLWFFRNSSSNQVRSRVRPRSDDPLCFRRSTGQDGFKRKKLRIHGTCGIRLRHVAGLRSSDIEKKNKATTFAIRWLVRY